MSSDQQQQPNSGSPLLKREESTPVPNSSRSTPAPAALQFQIPSNIDLKPSEIIGGAPVRQWLNEKVTPSLIQGMRIISKDQPDDPLRVLGEFLIQESKKQ